MFLWSPSAEFLKGTSSASIGGVIDSDPSSNLMVGSNSRALGTGFRFLAPPPLTPEVAEICLVAEDLGEEAAERDEGAC